jgi:hypothetical protein
MDQRSLGLARAPRPQRRNHTTVLNWVEQFVGGVEVIGSVPDGVRNSP